MSQLLDPIESVPSYERRRHILDLDDFYRGETEQILNTTDAMKEVMGRDIRKIPTLRGKTIITLFYEPSTRTRVSFEEAGKILSADVINIGLSGSSAAKGESLVNTALTLQAAGADVIVVRHPDAGAPYLIARQLEHASVINAGDGSHAHPTQALLDLYTIRSAFGRIQGLRVVITGDILHSRVARSNLWGLTAMGAQVVVCGPPTLIPMEMSIPHSGSAGPLGHPMSSVTVETSLEKAMYGADVVMVLRLQEERFLSGLIPSLREYSRLYQLDEERLAMAKPNVLVMHPGPMNEGIEISSAVAHGVQSVIQNQVTNGVALRMALLYMLTVSNQDR